MAGDAHQSARAHSNRRFLCLLMPMLLISALCSTAQRTYVRWAAFLSQLNRSTRSVNPPSFRRAVSDLECRVPATTPVDLQAPLILRRLSLCAFTTVSLRCAAESLRWWCAASTTLARGNRHGMPVMTHAQWAVTGDGGAPVHRAPLHGHCADVRGRPALWATSVGASRARQEEARQDRFSAWHGSLVSALAVSSPGWSDVRGPM